MKKIMIGLTVFFQVILLISCTSQFENDATEFIAQFNESSLKSEYSSGTTTYGIVLSDSTETIYQYKIEGSNYYINVVEERSFSQYDIETQADLYNEAKSVRNMFYANTIDLQLYDYNFELSSYTKISELNNSNINYVITVIHQYLEKDGNLVSFSEIYPIIDEALRIGEEYGQMSFFGDFNIKFMTLTVPKDIFLKNAVNFKEHLLLIYGEIKYNEVNESINNVDYENLHLKFEWDTEADILLPYFIISFRNIEYYRITVNEEKFLLQANPIL